MPCLSRIDTLLNQVAREHIVQFHARTMSTTGGFMPDVSSDRLLQRRTLGRNGVQGHSDEEPCRTMPLAGSQASTKARGEFMDALQPPVTE